MNSIVQQTFEEFDEIKELRQARAELIKNNSSWTPDYTYYAYNCSYSVSSSKDSFNKFVDNVLDDKAVAELKSYVETRHSLNPIPEVNGYTIGALRATAGTLESFPNEIFVDNKGSDLITQAAEYLRQTEKRLRDVNDEKRDLISQIVNRLPKHHFAWPSVTYTKREWGPRRTGKIITGDCCAYLDRVLTDEFVEGLYDLDQKFNSIKEQYELWARVKAPAHPA